jgi:hypothetical protein
MWQPAHNHFLSPMPSPWPCSVYSAYSSSSFSPSGGVPHGWLASVSHKVCVKSLIGPRIGSTQLFTECDTMSSHRLVHREKGDEETASSLSNTGPDSTYAQFISIAILEFGVFLHPIPIGLTLAVYQDFIVLFVVVIFRRQSLPPLSLCLRNSSDPQKHLRVSGSGLVSPSSRLGRNTTGSPSLALSCTVSLPDWHRRWFGRSIDIQSQIHDCLDRQRCHERDQRWDPDLCQSRRGAQFPFYGPAGR